MRSAWIVVGAILVAASTASCGSSGSTAKTDANSPIPPTSPAPKTTTSSVPKRSTTPTTKPGPANLAGVKIGLTTVVTGLEAPVAVAWRTGDTRMFVAEQTGRVRVVSANGELSPAPLLTIGPLSNGNEEGLLGITFSPDGSKLYVDYTDPGMDVHVDEYTMSGTDADASTRRQVMLIDHPFSNHNGGEVLTGPDGMLYIGLGDGGGAGDPKRNGQNPDALLAKILRINPQASGDAPYSVPADNPFVGRADARPEVWMWGLRNPWRFSFDRATGDMWIGDVGQNLYEEIDLARAGEKGINWGWSEREGLHSYRGPVPAGARDPIVETNHANGSCAIVGGYVYRGSAVPSLRGVYVYGDNCRPDLFGVVATPGKPVATRNLRVQADSLTSFGEDPSGELYTLARRDGTISRITSG